ncbi:dihydrodipicolinate synthase family protein [Desulfosoma caldarium]|uniref:Uncharacterized protein n=1 Tax=Desulfosoma caldarium TaxID=610254 RepID=A0A3N1UQY9_9BACT|nr:hypothetical protein [Desulfosoma caldarium]ROQ93514.1 hypothetical protein EDC27_1537 [Desulfosoma caldarium]
MTDCRLRGLWCRLYIPDDLDAMDWPGFVAAAAPFVDGWVIDPPFWRLSERGVPLRAQDLETIPELIPRLPDYHPVAVRITGRDRAETLDNVHRLEQALEKDAHFSRLLWLDTPLYYHGNRGLPTLYQQLAVVSHRSFVLENDPHRVRPAKAWGRHVNLRTSVVKLLAANPRITGLIHHGSLKRVLTYAKAVVKRPDFGLMDGEERPFLEYPSTTGLVSITANVVPRLWKKLMDRKSLSARAQDTHGYMAVMKGLLKLLDAMDPEPVRTVPWALHHLGFLHEASPLPDDRARRLLRCLESAGH